MSYLLWVDWFSCCVHLAWSFLHGALLMHHTSSGVPSWRGLYNTWNINFKLFEDWSAVKWDTLSLISIMQLCHSQYFRNYSNRTATCLKCISHNTTLIEHWTLLFIKELGAFMPRKQYILCFPGHFLSQGRNTNKLTTILYWSEYANQCIMNYGQCNYWFNVMIITWITRQLCAITWLD